jgi:hypothetical protein
MDTLKDKVECLFAHGVLQTYNLTKQMRSFSGFYECDLRTLYKIRCN